MFAPATSNRQTVIPARYFYDEDIFASEQREIFQKTWQFFCLKTDLLHDNDFVAHSVGGEPVVVQNLKGKLVAFHNVCSHRYSPVQTACAGNRPLACPYHGWKYSDTGVPIGIPHNLDFYPIAAEEKPRHALKPVLLETCGNLVFVAIAARRTLREELGEWHELVSKIGAGLDDLYFTTSLPADCNWKFAVHNAFDDIHAEFVHPSSSLDTSVYTGARWSFHPFSAEEDPGFDYSKRHAQLSVSMNAETVERNEKLWAPWFPDRAFPFDEYMHLFLYPNLIITSVQGFWYNIVRYNPVSGGRSNMTNWLVPSAPLSGASKATPELLYRLALGSLRVFGEDVQAVETSQRGIASVTRPGILGRREDKIAAFEEAYMRVMGGEPLSERKTA
jgi:phenylpropionate dioxygenase-like ring-hydroxylating dioxygenase large terminal subunit